MWELFDDEFVEGIGGRVDGPTFVRVSEFLDSDELKV